MKQNGWLLLFVDEMRSDQSFSHLGNALTLEISDFKVVDGGRLFVGPEQTDAL